MFLSSVGHLIKDMKHLRQSAETVLADCRKGMQMLVSDDAHRGAAIQAKVTETIASWLLGRP